MIKYNSILFNDNAKYYDFAALRNSEYRFFIINGIMDDGKTFGAKLDMLKDFKKNKNRSIWVMNSVRILDEELLKFTSALSDYDNDWTHFEIRRDKSGIGVGYYKEEIVCYFVAISSVTKTARDDRIKNIYYDEFNYFPDKRVYNQQIQKWNMLLSRNMYINKIFLIGNATSLNIPILHNLNIFEVKESFFEFDMNGFKGLFHNFKRKKEIIKEKYKNSIAFAYMEKSGYSKHSFDNVYLLDDINKVDKDFKKKYRIKKEYTFQIGESIFVNIYKVLIDKTYIFIGQAKEEDKKNIRYFLDRDFMKDGQEYAPDISEGLADYFQYDKIWYENITIKQHFYQVISRFIYLVRFNL